MKANDEQVGGKHYQTGGLQHWDIVHMFNLGYFEGQITKYLFRWKSKNGVEDLKKARHFLDKLIELQEVKPTSGLEIMLQVPNTLLYEGGSMAEDFWQCRLCRLHMKSPRGELPKHDTEACLETQKVKDSSPPPAEPQLQVVPRQSDG